MVFSDGDSFLFSIIDNCGTDQLLQTCKSLAFDGFIAKVAAGPTISSCLVNQLLWLMHSLGCHHCDLLVIQVNSLVTQNRSSTVMFILSTIFFHITGLSVSRRVPYLQHQEVVGGGGDVCCYKRIVTIQDCLCYS